MTVTDLMRGIGTDLGEIVIRGVDVHCTMNRGRCSLEEDLAELLQPDESRSGRPSGMVSVQDIAVAVTDVQTGSAWRITQSNADIQLRPESIHAAFAGVLSEPGGNAGSIQANVSLDDHAPERWQLQLDCETLPLSVVSLVRRRFPQAASPIPGAVSGNTTGSLRLSGLSDGTVAAAFDQIHIRHFQASDFVSGSRVWSNQTASISGELTLTPDRMIGRNLVASTDFASAKLDGSFARSITWTGGP